MVEEGVLPERRHNAVSRVTIAGTDVLVARTGYTGEPICFELFVPVERIVSIWDALSRRGGPQGVLPVGLGARDTLRLEAGMPLYGHEFGCDPDGTEIPAFAVPLVRVAVSFEERKGAYVGRAALARQRDDVRRMAAGEAPSGILPRRIRKVAVLDRGVARHGDEVSVDGKTVGVVTSGTMTPYWRLDESGDDVTFNDTTDRRAIALAYVDSEYTPGQDVAIRVRKRLLAARLVQSHGRSREAPCFRPIVQGH
jgi:aminomethyltransferase